MPQQVRIGQRRCHRYQPAASSKARVFASAGLASHAEVASQLQAADGVMIGRQAYHDPWWMAETDARWFGDVSLAMNRMGVVDQMVDYAAGQVAQGVPLRAITRHMLGLYQGVPGARAWRRLLSDAGRLKANDPALIREAAHLAEPLQMAA